VLAQTSGRISFDEYEGDDPGQTTAYTRTEEVAEQLGEEVAADENAFAELLPELGISAARLAAFGRGLASATAPRAIWDRLVAAFVATPDRQRGGQVLKGFLRQLAEADAVLVGEFLDAAVSHPLLGTFLPELQCSVSIGKIGAQRLKRAIAIGLAPIWRYRALAWGKSHESIGAGDLKDLVELIAAVPGGTEVGLEIVFYRLYGDNEAKRAHEPEVIDAGRALLAGWEIQKSSSREDHEIGLVVETCLTGADGEPIAAKLSEGLLQAAKKLDLNAGNNHDILSGLFKVQPQQVLTTLFGGDSKKRQASLQLLRLFDEHRPSPLDAVPECEVLAWCQAGRAERYGTMASAVSYLRKSPEDPSSQWSDIALKLLAEAPDPVAVARAFAQRFRPSGWSGSLAAILEGRRALLAELRVHPNPRVVEFALAEDRQLIREIAAERDWKRAQEQQMDQRFE
jgi:hypothetical protein